MDQTQRNGSAFCIGEGFHSNAAVAFVLNSDVTMIHTTVCILYLRYYVISFDSRQDAISGIYTFKNILRDPNDVRYNEGCVCVRVRVRVCVRVQLLKTVILFSFV